MTGGENPNRIAARINKNLFGDDKKKGNIAWAKRIARTEITNAHRKAIWDEDRKANEIEGIRTKMMQISALIPGRTRHSHALRHGGVYSRKEVDDWYKENGNAINCFLPETKVRGRFCAGSKAYYKGEVVSLVTAGGRNLTVTLNHPVMTSAGLIAAQKSQKEMILLHTSIRSKTLLGHLH